jgi:hypothetical protein
LNGGAREMSSAAVMSLDLVDQVAPISQVTNTNTKSIIPQPTDLGIPRLTDVIGAFLFYAFCNWTG